MDDPTWRQKPFHLVPVCIAACFLLMLASCESGPRSAATTFNQNHSATASAPTATPGPGEYVYSGPTTAAMYLALTGISTGSVAGQLQLAQIAYDSSIQKSEPTSSCLFRYPLITLITLMTVITLITVLSYCPAHTTVRSDCKLVTV